MEPSIFEIIIRPFRYKNILQRLFTAFLLFLPFIISLKLEEMTLPWLIALGIVPAIVTFGYFWVIFNHEIYEKDDSLPEWQVVDCFFIGLKGFIFVLAFISLYIITLLAIWLLVYFVPIFKIPAIILSTLLSIYWFFFLFAVSASQFADEYRFNDAFNFSQNTQIAENCWWEYLKAIFYLVIALGFMVLAAVAFLVLFYFVNPVLGRLLSIGFVFLYSILVYIILQARVYQNIKDSFENYI